MGHRNDPYSHENTIPMDNFCVVEHELTSDQTTAENL